MRWLLLIVCVALPAEALAGALLLTPSLRGEVAHMSDPWDAGGFVAVPRFGFAVSYLVTRDLGFGAGTDVSGGGAYTDYSPGSSFNLLSNTNAMAQFSNIALTGHVVLGISHTPNGDGYLRITIGPLWTKWRETRIYFESPTDQITTTGPAWFLGVLVRTELMAQWELTRWLGLGVGTYFEYQVLNGPAAGITVEMPLMPVNTYSRNAQLREGQDDTRIPGHSLK